MMLRKNKCKVIENLKKGKIDTIETLYPNVVDNSLAYLDNKYSFDKLINDNINLKKHTDAISVPVFIYMLLSSKMKRLFAINESIFALT